MKSYEIVWNHCKGNWIDNFGHYFNFNTLNKIPSESQFKVTCEFEVEDNFKSFEIPIGLAAHNQFQVFICSRHLYNSFLQETFITLGNRFYLTRYLNLSFYAIESFRIRFHSNFLFDNHLILNFFELEFTIIWTVNSTSLIIRWLRIVYLYHKNFLYIHLTHQSRLHPFISEVMTNWILNLRSVTTQVISLESKAFVCNCDCNFCCD